MRCRKRRGRCTTAKAPLETVTRGALGGNVPYAYRRMYSRSFLWPHEFLSRIVGRGGRVMTRALMCNHASRNLSSFEKRLTYYSEIDYLYWGVSYKGYQPSHPGRVRKSAWNVYVPLAHPSCSIDNPYVNLATPRISLSRKTRFFEHIPTGAKHAQHPRPCGVMARFCSPRSHS